ncbi:MULTISPECIES: hypothetical protein [unclassified Psychrobacillus]|uniref:hypothetical protein n=1 Tax=unclassified Psychrobacillus TaxID=2636677 RepID=UPI0030F6AA97
MGVTIKSKSFSADMGYGGFNLYRKKIATLSSLEFGNHFSKLDKAMSLPDMDREAFYKKYNKQTDELIKRNVITSEIANFCYQSDCEGSIDQRQAKLIYEKIKDEDDNICYGYAGRSDCAMFSDLKHIFKDCAENGGKVKWH